LSSWDSEQIHRLLASSDVDIIGFPRVDAYIALYPYLTKVRLPRGVGNMADNRPPSDVDLVAAKATLIVRGDLNAGIQYLLLQAAMEIHSLPSVFQRQDQFPNAERGDVPLSAEARDFYRNRRPPFWQRYLHFWIGILVHRVLLMLIPALAVAYPFLRSLPALYIWMVRRRILRLYSELRLIETELLEPSRASAKSAGTALRQLEERANRLRVPPPLTPKLYTLRGHIAMIQGRHGLPRVTA